MLETASKLQSKLLPEDKLERCGVILADGSIVEADNTHEFPERGFKLNASVLMEHEADLVGTWHTHPGGTANLSQEDYAGFLQWPELQHWIVGVDGVRCWKADNGLIVEVDLD